MGKTHTRSVRLKPSPPSLKLEAGAVNIYDFTLPGCTGLEVCLQNQVSNKLYKRSSKLDSGKQANVSPTKIKQNAVETLLDKLTGSDTENVQVENWFVQPNFCLTKKNPFFLK